MRVRLAHLKDLRNITNLVHSKVVHDGFHDYFFPHQDEYPKDMYIWWYKYLRSWILQPYTAVLVAESDSDEIIGMAAWGFGPRAFEGATDVSEPVGVNIAKNSLFERLRRHYFALIDKIAGKLRPNRAADSATLAEWGKVMREVSQKHWSGSDRVRWFCSEIAVHTDYEDSSLFSNLLDWGFIQSDIDSVNAFGGCGPMELEKYKNEGFSILDTVECGPVTAIILKHKS